MIHWIVHLDTLDLRSQSNNQLEFFPIALILYDFLSIRQFVFSSIWHIHKVAEVIREINPYKTQIFYVIVDLYCITGLVLFTVILISDQIRSVIQSCPTLCDCMNRSTQASLSITNSRSSLRLMSIESVMSPSHFILCFPLLLLPPIPPSIRVFSNESTLCMRWPKYWSFSFSIIPSKEIPGLISFRMDWLDLQMCRWL